MGFLISNAVMYNTHNVQSCYDISYYALGMDIKM